MKWLLVAYKQDETRGEQFKYMLRSLERNYLDLDHTRIVVVGDKPDWLTNVVHLEGNPFDDKACNMLSNVFKGCEHLHSLGARQVVYMSDDYVLMDPTDSIVNCYSHVLSVHMARVARSKGREDYYWRRLERTRSILALSGIENPLSFELHRPMVLDPVKAMNMFAAFERPDDAPFWRTLYGNLAQVTAVQAEDGRVDGDRRLDVPAGAPWLSGDDGPWDGYFGEMVRRRFPSPSRWEW